jgi:phosphopantothenoylcysteine decarboxylase/phosphopantothenate--cysteine ligase
VQHASEKIKRTSTDLVIQLKANPDIAARLGAVKTDHQVTVGFALETNDEEANAKQKIKDKNFDFIVLNSPNNQGEGFMSDTNRITISYRNLKRSFCNQSDHLMLAGSFQIGIISRHI